MEQGKQHLLRLKRISCADNGWLWNLESHNNEATKFGFENYKPTTIDLDSIKTRIAKVKLFAEDSNCFRGLILLDENNKPLGELGQTTEIIKGKPATTREISLDKNEYIIGWKGKSNIYSVLVQFQLLTMRD